MTPRAQNLSAVLVLACWASLQVWPDLPVRPAPLPRPMPDAEVLLVGDSTVWGWTYWGTPSFAELGGRTQNLGLPSYRAAHLAADAHRLAGSRADVVVVQLGAADVSGSDSPEDIAAALLLAVEAVHAAIPGATVLVLELVPRVTPEAAGRTVDVNLRLRDVRRAGAAGRPTDSQLAR